MDENRLAKRFKASDELSNNKIVNLVKKENSIEDSIYQNDSPTSDQTNNILILKWSIRDDLISCLNQLNSLLFGILMQDEIKAKIVEEIHSLIFKLIKLPLRLNETNAATNDIVLHICIDTRIKIINNLINNSNYAIAYAGIPDKIKMNLIDENNQIIDKLLKWPVSNAKPNFTNYFEQQTNKGKN